MYVLENHALASLLTSVHAGDYGEVGRLKEERQRFELVFVEVHGMEGVRDTQLVAIDLDDGIVINERECGYL